VVRFSTGVDSEFSVDSLQASSCLTIVASVVSFKRPDLQPMWKDNSLSSAHDLCGADSIREVIEGFCLGVDEVLVISNADEGTAEEVAKTDARQVFESK
jgi:hypothetical protein